ncbi:MAG TPA: secretion system protein [Candidatus Moranbacteria bacterium]|nr:secretion system protein [Candidatus Moranbacteria bacterium]
MRIFFTAKSFSGETKSGEMNVKDERDLAGQLRSEGFILTSLKQLEEEKGNRRKINFLDRFATIPVSEKMMLARNLSVMISSGLPLARAISNITAQTKNKRFVKVLDEIQGAIQSGSTFGDALAKFPAIFDELFVNMVRVGEASGNLEEVLNILAGQLQKEHELLNKVKGAMTYPAVIIMAMIGIGILMMIYVVPQITGVFKDLNAELPPTTQFIISSSNFMRDHYFIVFSGIVSLILGVKLSAGTEKGKKFFSYLAISIPVVNKIVIEVNCARFSRIYSSLLRSGISVVETLKILSRTLGNHYYKKALERGAENIQKGVNLSKIFYEEKKIFPVLVPQMLEVGEETGKTEAVLMKLAEFYEEEVDQKTRNLSSIIEPVLMIVIGSAVGFFAISILQPMYSVLENIK